MTLVAITTFKNGHTDYLQPTAEHVPLGSYEGLKFTFLLAVIVEIFKIELFPLGSVIFEKLFRIFW